MNKHYSAMRSNVSMLGKLLGDTIEEAMGTPILDQVESIRRLSKSSRAGNGTDRQELLTTLQNLSNDELLPVARAFNQFLNLANTAEQYASISPHGEAINCANVLEALFNRLRQQNISHADIESALRQLSIELVLTAHPTEITRRTLIHKLAEINLCLQQLDHDDLMEYERNRIMHRLRQLVAQSWYTDEIRKQRPTPIDEAKWGFAVVENSLWQGVPLFLREYSDQVEQLLGYRLPMESVPVRFTSWMGGDRDGNPAVTAQVTQHTLLLSRWKAAELFLADIQTLISELSMRACTAELQQLAGGEGVLEPYRAILKQLRGQLTATLHWLNLCMDEEGPVPRSADVLIDNEQIWEPLLACYRSLHACGMGIIADGQLLDTLRRIGCFGLQLVRVDIRQESTLHSNALAELTRYLGLGDYASWSERDKQNFLLHELNSKRPLLPARWECSALTREILQTCQVIASAPADSIAAYVISMARTPSDVLAVHLLLKESGCSSTLPVVPLFETLDDLNNACGVMQQLLHIDWYRGAIQGQQMVMIGYSDSAKDAGVISASWAQYRAQEELIALFEREGVILTLFHGRGGTIGRGGAPAHAALLSQPPGSLKGGFRVTEQGEMIRFKLGLPEVAVGSLTLYTAAILEANLLPPPAPKQQWRDLMDQLAEASCRCYRQCVREHPDFVSYFRAATPERELANLPLGSRPVKRRAEGGVESLRAIPWIFAWMQNRLMLPAWLGAGEALQDAIDQGQQPQLEEMCRDWPFFSTRLGMLEMVYSKTDLWLAEYYDHRLVDAALWPLGKELRTQLARDIKLVLTIANDEHLMEDHPWIAEVIALRNIYTDPLNVLQAELLYRSRQQTEPDPRVEQALMITIAGIATGMRNTG